MSALIVCCAGIIQYTIYEYIEPAQFLLFYPAVILGALYGDGTSAILLSAFLGQYFFAGTTMSWPNDVVRLAFFMTSGFMIRKIIRQQVMEKLRAESIVLLLNEEKLAREKFVSTLSHDLQTPLTSAKLQIQLLLRKKDNKETDNLNLGKVHLSIIRIENMIRDLLDANRIHAGERLHLKIDECELRELVESTVADLNIQYGDRFRVKRSSPVHGFWNCEGIRRIIENICTNAVKYGEENSPVTIQLEKASEGVLLSIHNQGIPIPENDIPFLFQPYHRSKNAEQGEKAGWGLGLTLVKGLTEAHGGMVKVESTAAGGTIFTVYLPLDARKNAGY